MEITIKSKVNIGSFFAELKGLPVTTWLKGLAVALAMGGVQALGLGQLDGDAPMVSVVGIFLIGAVKSGALYLRSSPLQVGLPIIDSLLVLAAGSVARGALLWTTDGHFHNIEKLGTAIAVALATDIGMYFTHRPK